MTPGRCGNLDYCSIGMQRVLVRVPVSKPFLCPECGGDLHAPPGIGSAQHEAWRLAAHVALATAALGVPLAFGYVLGRSHGPAGAPSIARSLLPAPSCPRPVTGAPGFGQITMECVQPAAQPRPSCNVVNTSGARIQPGSAPGWLWDIGAHYDRNVASAAVPPDRRWRIVLEDVSGAPTPQRP
jgi:hypothetical protein